MHGLVLAGGRSSRFGSDKAAVVVNDRPQLDYLVNELRGLVVDVRVSIAADQAGDALRSSYPVVIDPAPDLGPAAGLLAAHGADPAAAWLVVACDMPRLSPALLQQLIDARDPVRDAVCFKSPDGQPEPLCAIYEPATLAAMANAVATSERVPGPRQWLADSDATMLEPQPDALQSFNTAEELSALTKTERD